MLSGKKSKKSQLKAFLFVIGLVCFFAYANLSAKTQEHQAGVMVLPNDKLITELIKDIAHAKESIHIAMYMFKPYQNTKYGAGLIKKQLIKAAKKGVKVYVALEHTGKKDFLDKANNKIGKQLKKHGITVVYDKPDNRMHSKCAVIDGKITYIGSHNYTNSALKYNRELTVRISSQKVAKETIEHIISVE